ncbi:MAG: hypothetical protein M1133_12760 [Armatimonadetes bacterium]|nr:hypothetical protein [Armatimonadota bacterium]
MRQWFIWLIAVAVGVVIGFMAHSLIGFARPPGARLTLDQEIRLSRGKIAAHDVYDDHGNLIVAQGQEITTSVIQQALVEDEMEEVALAAGLSGHTLKNHFFR